MRDAPSPWGMSHHGSYDPQTTAPAPAEQKPKRKGPASKLTDALAGQIAASLAKGYTKRHAAALAGIPEVTLSTWLRRGRDLPASTTETPLGRAPPPHLRGRRPQLPRLWLATQVRSSPDLCVIGG